MIFDKFLPDWNVYLRILYALIWITCTILSIPILLVVFSILIFIDLLMLILEMSEGDVVTEPNLFIVYLKYISFYMSRKAYFEYIIDKHKFLIFLLALAIDIVLLPFELIILCILIFFSPGILLFIALIKIGKLFFSNNPLKQTVHNI